MDFREYAVTREGDEVVVAGTIREPVTWDFSIRIAADDIPGMLRVGLNRHTMRLALRWLLHRRPRSAETKEETPVAARAAGTPAPIGSSSRARALMDPSIPIGDPDVA
jgi:hypothetical protein